MGELLRDPETWVGIGTLIFLAVLVWKKVPAMVGASLDARAAGIAKELDEARRLREEAETLLRQYQAKGASAEKEAAAIVTEAKSDAERYAKEARLAIDAAVARRAKQAEDRIAQAEAQALSEVRALAADAAVAAAGKLIAAQLDDKQSAALIKSALSEVPSKLN
jgi:F-type H+-transporting ATPase subunit b